MTDEIPFGETVSDSRPMVLSWDRCEGGEGYFGAIFDVKTKEVIHMTWDYPVKRPVGHDVVRWMEANEYKLNRDSWEWERTYSLVYQG